MNKKIDEKQRRGSLQLTKKVNYAIILLTELAFETDAVSLKDIAELKRLSFSFLQRVARDLVRVGYVVATRGKYGGYALNVDKDELTLLDVIECVDGPILMMPCLQVDDSIACKRVVDCTIKSNLNKMNGEIRDYLRMFTIGGLVK